MKIGLVRRRYTPYGGAEVFLDRFIDGLIGRGHSVALFASRWEEREGVEFHGVPEWGPSFMRPLVFAVNASRAAAAARCDVVLGLERTWCHHVYRAGDGCHREWLERRKRFLGPARRLLLALNPLHRVLLYIERRLFTAPDLRLVVANSQRVRREIAAHYGLPPERIRVIYNGIAPPEPGAHRRAQARRAVRSGLGIAEDDVVVLFVGSGFERKGLGFLIEALALLCGDRENPGARHVRLVVVGKGGTRRYRRLARRLGVEGRIRFAGPQRATPDYYLAADVFALPTIYEPFSNACLEAMALGLPVVTTRANGVAEIMTDGVEGAIVDDPADAAALASALSRFLDEGARAEAGRRAAHTASAYTMERTVDEFLKELERVACADT